MKKLGLILVVIVISNVLVGCGRPKTETVGSAQEKLPFYVETTSLEKLASDSLLSKSGKILGSQDIIVSSQAAGRVSSINQTVGSELGNGSVVVKLTDTSGVYSFAAQRANAAVRQAQINYEQTINSLDKALSDTEIAIKQAQNQADNSALGMGDTGASLQLQQLESQLDKAQIDLETKIRSDQQTIDNFIATTKTLVQTVKLLYDDVVKTGDELLGVTDLRKYDNDNFESVLGIRNTISKTTAQRTLRELLPRYESVKNYAPFITQESLNTDLQMIQGFVQALNPVLDDLDSMLDYTDPKETFPQSRIDLYTNTISGLQAQVQAQNSSITQQINGIESFLSTYKQQQDSIRQSIDSIKKQVAGTQEQLKTASVSAGLNVESAQTSYNNTLKNKKTTEAGLINAITQAKIAASEAQTNLAKLTIKAPIAGTIGDVFVDVGQEVAPGTPIFSITSTQDQQIEIALTSEEVSRVEEGQEVTITSEGNTYKGTLVSVASASNATLGYKAIVRLDEKVSLVGTVASVAIPLKTVGITIPLKYVKILNKDQGQITLLKGGSPESVLVGLGKVWGSMVEVTSDQLNEKSIIITNDISNYDPTSFTLTEKP